MIRHTFSTNLLLTTRMIPCFSLCMGLEFCGQRSLVRGYCDKLVTNVTKRVFSHTSRIHTSLRLWAPWIVLSSIQRVYKLHVHITVTEKYDPTGILLLWVNESSNWVYSSGLYAYPKGIQIPVPAGPGRHRYYIFPVEGECRREQSCLQTQQQTVVTPRRTKQGMLECQNFCFQRFGSVKLRI